MNTIQDIEIVYRRRLEEDIIAYIAGMKNISLDKAMDAYYKSKLCRQIYDQMYGLENMDYKYLAIDLLENEPELFV